MSVTGLCQICESATAQSQCDRCGTIACQQHYHEEFGMCIECARTARPGDGDDIDEFQF